MAWMVFPTGQRDPGGGAPHPQFKTEVAAAARAGAEAAGQFLNYESQTYTVEDLKTGKRFTVNYLGEVRKAEPNKELAKTS